MTPSAAAAPDCANNCNADIKSVRWKPCPCRSTVVGFVPSRIATSNVVRGHGFQRTLLISALQLLAQKAMSLPIHGRGVRAIKNRDIERSARSFEFNVGRDDSHSSTRRI